jgi:hypothetical protein
VVHLSERALAISFAAQLDDLRRAIATSWSPTAPETGFVEWAAVRCQSSLDFDVGKLDLDSLSAQRWAEAPVLAAVGFRLDTPACPGFELDRWLDGMQRLMSRDAVPADRNSFFFRPLELLGLVVGSCAAEATDGSVLRWIRETMDVYVGRMSLSTPWSRELVALAAHEVGASAYSIDPVVPKGQLEVALALWLHLVDESVASSITTVDAQTLRIQLLEMTATHQAELHGVAEQGVMLLGLRDAVLTAVGGTQLHPSNAAQSVVNLCRRFPLFVSELHSRHAQRPAFDVNDEYDVQDLLRSALRLHFADVRREEWNPSYGGTQSRSDLLLKHERVVVETKMTRNSLRQPELVKELIVDKAQYRNHPDCRTLVCFVYDPDLRLTNPEAVERDLSGNDGTLDTLVVVAPQGL